MALLLASCSFVGKERFTGLAEPYPTAYELELAPADAWKLARQELERRPIVRVLAQESGSGLLAWSEEMPWSQCSSTLAVPSDWRSPWRMGVAIIFRRPMITVLGPAADEPATVVWVMRLRERSGQTRLFLRATCLHQEERGLEQGRSLGKLENQLAQRMQRSAGR